MWSMILLMSRLPGGHYSQSFNHWPSDCD